MKTEKHPTPNFGILASISWNSNAWAGDPTDEDLKKSNYDYVKEHGRMHESLNFGQDKYPAEADGYYIGYTPMFNRPPAADRSKNVKVVFFSSNDHRIANRKLIVGLYGHPIIERVFEREANHKVYGEYDAGNVKALPENIIYFDNPIAINDDFVEIYNLLPEGKKISQQGFNYLDSDNVFNIITIALSLNPENKKLQRFIQIVPELNDLATTDHTYSLDTAFTADTSSEIEDLEEMMQGVKPEAKERISTYIERGAISQKVKKLNGYRCSVCESLGKETQTFLKSNGEPYIETHHVIPVSSGKKGVLSINNLMTVCANHHRQLHYGIVELVEVTDDHFVYKIDGVEVRIDKIKL